MAQNAPFNYQIASIANGASLSQVIDLYGVGTGSAIVGLEMPAAWTAASITFSVSHDIGTQTFKDYYDDAGTEITVTAAASRFIRLIPSLFAGIRYIKVRSGTSGSPVNQGAARDVKLVVRAV